MFVNEPFLTCSRNQVPLSNTEFTAVDQGIVDELDATRSC